MTPPSLAYVSVAGENRIVGVRMPGPNGPPAVEWEVGLGGRPGALVLSPDGRHLYAAVRSTRSVAWFEVGPSGELRFGGSIGVGLNPVHLAVSPNGAWLLYCSYGEHRVGGCPMEAGVPGPPGPALDVGRNPHALVFAPGGRWIHVPCLGEDRIRTLRLDRGGPVLDGPGAALPRGSGPRHLDFHASGGWAGCVGELSNRIEVLTAGADGSLTWMGGAATRPPWARWRRGAAAHLKIGPDGRIYVSNRGHDSVAVFAPPVLPVVESDRLCLRRLGTMRTESAPRAFDLAPDGATLVVAGRTSGHLAFHALGRGTGAGPEYRLAVGSEPVWVLMAPDLPR